MKKFLSMVMAAAMVVSLVPATAFAKEGVTLEGTASVVGSESFQDNVSTVETKTAEVVLTLTKADYTGDALAFQPALDFSVVLDNAFFKNKSTQVSRIRWFDADGAGWTTLATSAYTLTPIGSDNDEVQITLKGDSAQNAADSPFGAEGLEKGDKLAVLLETTMDKVGNGRSARVSLDSDDFTISNATDLTYATVGRTGVTASVRKTVDIAVEEVNSIEEVVIKPSVGETFLNTFKTGDDITLRVSGGFEFAGSASDIKVTVDGTPVATAQKVDSDEILLTNIDATTLNAAQRFVINGIKLDAADAKEGAVASLKIYVPNCDTVSVEVAKVIGSAVTLTVDADEDVPTYYTGTDLKDTGITSYQDHESVEITIKETFPGAWNVAKDWTLTLSEGVYAVEEITDGKGMTVYSPNVINDGNVLTSDQIEAWFEAAYDEGDYDNFTFKKRTWDVTEPGDDVTEFTFKLKLVADPNFVSASDPVGTTKEVTLTLEGEAVDTQTVTIAKFQRPFTVEAQQNDLQIDYRNTAVGSNIVIKEAEAGLWRKGTEIAVSLDKIAFDKGATVTVDEKSGMEVKNVNTTDGVITFTVDKVSADEPAVITISDLELYMDRSLPAGKYDLSVYSPTMLNVYDKDSKTWDYTDGYLTQQVLGDAKIIDDFTDRFYSTEVKEGFVNIITAGREDSESFTTKLVIPIGSTTMTAGENQITLDAPAYISADGYTMLPLRAVATALGIPNESVMWDGATRTVTIMYGSKVIVMTVGQKTMYLSGSPVPASAAPEITNDRTFLPVRDLGTALGVSDLTWDTDPATGKVSTVYVNANK